MRSGVQTLALLASIILIPTGVYAQAVIAGFVRDTSGAVLPGVTVEASSPALIEKVRTTISDSNGQYRVEDLRPGVYKVSFSLTGFSTFEREGVELTGSFTATINAEMRVGAPGSDGCRCPLIHATHGSRVCQPSRVRRIHAGRVFLT